MTAATAAEEGRDNLRGGAWMLADMSLNIWALSIVKALGAGYPSAQIVFLRASVGLVLILPLVWRRRHLFRGADQLGLHLLRVMLSVVALTMTFFAIARVPFALYTAVNFIRPMVTMVMAAALLGERIGRARWIAAAIAFAGVFIAVNPRDMAWSWGLAALAVLVFAGSGAIIATRRLRAAPEIVMMTFYTAGLTAFTAPLAALSWVPIERAHLLPLLLVGVFAQTAQLCFLRAHHAGEAGFLSVLGYLSLVLSISVGYFVFDEVPTAGFWLGAALVVGAALWTTLDARRVTRQAPSGSR